MRPPEAVNPDCLGCDSDYQDIGKLEGVISHDTVLERANHGHSRVQGVAEKEIADEVDKRLFEMPYLAKSTIQLPKPDCDYIHSGRNLILLAQEH